MLAQGVLAASLTWVADAADLCDVAADRHPGRAAGAAAAETRLQRALHGHCWNDGLGAERRQATVRRVNAVPAGDRLDANAQEHVASRRPTAVGPRAATKNFTADVQLQPNRTPVRMFLAFKYTVAR